MKALTVCQPWAWAIAEGLKPVENRTWPTSYRGWLLIHAGKSRQWFTCDTVSAISHLAGRFMVPGTSGMHFGAFVAVARLIGCDRLEQSPERNHRFAEGPYCWRLDDVRKCEWPVPCTGAQGLWEPMAKVADEVFAAAGVLR